MIGARKEGWLVDDPNLLCAFMTLLLPSLLPLSLSYSSLDLAFLHPILMLRSNPKEKDEDGREKRSINGFWRERESVCVCVVTVVYVCEKEVLKPEGVLKRERERERERERWIVKALRVNRSFPLIVVMCVAHDLAHVPFFLFDTCPCMQQVLQPYVQEILVH